uniref:Uncharacterized protein n=1 Tax=Nelumbo nucifera TaxID=4432 RepID=A0A822YLV4_NELNU|nr:TPA_asm: hypothetical protein HUJ06_010737 [Nelumbo nucifera]
MELFLLDSLLGDRHPCSLFYVLPSMIESVCDSSADAVHGQFRLQFSDEGSFGWRLQSLVMVVICEALSSFADWRPPMSITVSFGNLFYYFHSQFVVDWKCVCLLLFGDFNSPLFGCISSFSSSSSIFIFCFS